MTGNLADMHSRIALQIADAMRDAIQLNSEEADRLLDKVEGYLLSTVDLKEAYRVEVLRRISEAKISLFYRRSDASALMEQAWARIIHLGFSNAEREATTLLYRAKFLARNMNDERLQEVLSSLGDLIENKIRPTDPSMADHFSQFLNKR